MPLLGRAIATVPAEPPERMECALNHPAYPLFLAHLLDVAAEQGWELKPAAARLGVTPTALAKLFARDPALWTHVNAARAAAGLPALRRPGQMSAPFPQFGELPPALRRIRDQAQ